MKASFPAWKQAFDEQEGFDAYARELSIAFLERGITNARQVEAGIAKARESESPFLPSVGEFAGWCLSAFSNDLPNADRAYVMAAHWDWSAHPIVYQAALKVGVTEVKTWPTDKIKPAFVREYQALARRVMAGEAFEDQVAKNRAITQQRESLAHEHTTPEQAEAARGDLLRMLGLSDKRAES